MKARTAIVLVMIVTLLIGAPIAEAKKKKGLKGRYLETEPGVDLGEYEQALVVLDPATITADKDRAVDTESVRVTSDDALRERLKASGLFHDVVSQAPLEIPADRPVVRMTTRLTLQYGSQAMRFFVGAGAGKSKLHIRIDIVDAKSGASLGFFNGYGTGAGLWSISGGGVQRMARDDFEENYAKFLELLAERMR